MMINSTVSFFPPDNWKDLFTLDQPIDMEAFLKSDVLAQQRALVVKFSIASIVVGLVSLISSLLLVLYILRSQEGLSTTYHRLVFGLSISDVLQSFGHALSATSVPREMHYLVPYAFGDTASCNAGGFLFTVGGCASNLYNASICFYSLAIIKYNKKDEFIRKKLEPWFHGVSISIPLIISMAMVIKESFNNASNGRAGCFVCTFEPPHCIGFEVGQIPEGFSIPCGRGRHARLMGFVFLSPVIIVTPVVLIVTILLMHRNLFTIERKFFRRYGTNTRLRSSRVIIGTRSAPLSSTEAQQNGNDMIENVVEEGSSSSSSSPQRDDSRWISELVRVRRQSRSSNSASSVQERANHVISQKRAVYNMATRYTMAWFITFTPFSLLQYLVLRGSSAHLPDLILMLGCSTTTPLQGLVNFLVFMAPKARFAKKTGTRTVEQEMVEMSWGQAFYNAYFSRGNHWISSSTS